MVMLEYLLYFFKIHLMYVLSIYLTIRFLVVFHTCWYSWNIRSDSLFMIIMVDVASGKVMFGIVHFGPGFEVGIFFQ